jgi:hypothetical protein
MMSQTQEEVTWFGERSAGPMDDDPTDKNAISGDDEKRDQESEEEIHEDDLYVNYNLDNLDALVIDKDKITSQTREEVTWLGERSAGPMDDDPTDKNAIDGDDEERDQESEEEIHEDDLNVNYNIDNLDALVIDKEKMTSQTQEEVTWLWERSAGPLDEYEERDQESEEEIHEDDLYVHYDLDNLDAIVIDGGGKEHEEEESWEECDTQTTAVPDNDQIRTSRWGGDWGEEDEEQIRNIGGYSIGSQCTAESQMPPQQTEMEQTKEVAAARSILQDHVYYRPPVKLRLLTLGNSCTRCGREHDGSCAIGAAILSGCSSVCSQ